MSSEEGRMLRELITVTLQSLLSLNDLAFYRKVLVKNKNKDLIATRDITRSQILLIRTFLRRKLKK